MTSWIIRYLSCRPHGPGDGILSFRRKCSLRRSADRRIHNIPPSHREILFIPVRMGGVLFSNRVRNFFASFSLIHQGKQLDDAEGGTIDFQVKPALYFAQRSDRSRGFSQIDCPPSRCPEMFVQLTATSSCSRSPYPFASRISAWPAQDCPATAPYWPSSVDIEHPGCPIFLTRYHLLLFAFG